MAKIYNPYNDTKYHSCPFYTQYLAELVRNTDYVLCLSSAAQYMGLCNCSLDKTAYAFKENDCINEGIQYDQKNGVKYTDINQTINDLLSYDSLDEQIILESLADIYYDINGNGYVSLQIKQENQNAFNYYAPMAAVYYDY